MGIGFQTKSKSKKCTCWLNGCYHSTDKGLHCTKMKKEILNCIEKYRVLRTYWTTLVCIFWWQNKKKRKWKIIIFIANNFYCKNWFYNFIISYLLLFLYNFLTFAQKFCCFFLMSESSLEIFTWNCWYLLGIGSESLNFTLVIYSWIHILKFLAAAERRPRSQTCNIS